MTNRRASSSIDHTGKWKLVGSKIEWQEPNSLEQHLEQQEMDPTEEQSRRERRKAEWKQRRLDRCCAKVPGSRKRIGGVLDWLDERCSGVNEKAYLQSSVAAMKWEYQDRTARRLADSYKETTGVGPLTWWWIGELVIAVIKWWLAYRDEAEE